MSFYSTVHKIGGYYTFPRIGSNKYKPLRVTDLRDPRINEAIEEIKKELPNKELHSHILELWGYIARDKKGNYAPVSEQDSVIQNDEHDLKARDDFDNLVKNGVQFTIDPNLVSVEAMAEIFRNLPRSRLYLITQNEVTYTMNDKTRNEIVHSLIAHQSIVETSSENSLRVR
jgi:hypothetical protein